MLGWFILADHPLFFLSTMSRRPPTRTARSPSPPRTPFSSTPPSSSSSSFGSSLIAERERDREGGTSNFLCAFCRVRLETNVVHYCSRPSYDKKRCAKCKCLVADNTRHRCVQVVTTSVTYDDPDMEEIDSDIEEKLSSSVKIHIAHESAKDR